MLKLTLRPLPRRGERALRAGSGGQRGGDARHHFAGDAGGLQRLQFFFEAAEQAGVTALQAHHHGVFVRQLHQQRVDVGLRGGVVEAALAHVHPACVGRVDAQRGVGQGVEQHHVGGGQALCAAYGDEVCGTRAGADEDHMPHVQPVRP